MGRGGRENGAVIAVVSPEPFGLASEGWGFCPAVDSGEGTLVQEDKRGILTSGLMEGMDAPGQIGISREGCSDGLILSLKGSLLVVVADPGLTSGLGRAGGSITIGSWVVSSIVSTIFFRDFFFAR